MLNCSHDRSHEHPCCFRQLRPTGRTTRSDELGMRLMQERAWEKRGEQYLLIESPPASGKSRVLMFITLDKLKNQGVDQCGVEGLRRWKARLIRTETLGTAVRARRSASPRGRSSAREVRSPRLR